MEELIHETIVGVLVGVCSGAFSAFITVKILSVRVATLEKAVEKLWALHEPGHPHAVN